MMSFKEFIDKYNLKNKATSIIKIYQVLSSLFLNDVAIHSRDCLFDSDIGIVNLHPFQGTHWVFYIHECYFASYRVTPPEKLSKFVTKRNGHCLNSEKKYKA